MFGLFTKPPPEPKKSKAVIHENGGHYLLDEAYAKQGESEGWLIWRGFYEVNGELYSRYEHRA